MLCSVTYAQNPIVFEAEYQVAWKGWTCGIMQSQLLQNEDGSYQYTQTLKSSLFFYPFLQTEKSQFSIEQGQIVCQQYEIFREGIEGPCYTVLFGNDYMEIAVAGEDDLFHYAVSAAPVHDKLVTQLVLIRQILTDTTPGNRTVCFIDPSGIHHRTYTLNIQDQALIFSSAYGHKSSSFTLDPKKRYLPTLFQQYRHGHLVFTGDLVDAKFGPAWDNFLSAT